MGGVESGYQENFEDVLKEARLGGKDCKMFLVSGIAVQGRIKTIDANAVQLECGNGIVSFVRPQSIIALLTQVEADKQPGCPWCGS